MTPQAEIFVVTPTTMKEQISRINSLSKSSFCNRHNSKIIIIRTVILFQQPLNSCCATVLPASVLGWWKERVILLTKFQNNWRSFKIQTLLWYRNFKGEWKLQRGCWESKGSRIEFLVVGSSWLQIVSCEDAGSFFLHQKYVKTRNLICSALLDAICSCRFHDLMYKHEKASLPWNYINKHCLSSQCSSENWLYLWKPEQQRLCYKHTEPSWNAFGLV